MLELVCERSGEHKVPKRKVKHEATGSRKCGCLFKVRGYVVREDNAWKLTILNGVHNHEMVPHIAGHLLAGRLTEDDKKIVHDLTDGCPLPPSSTEWKLHRSEEAATWEDEFLDQHDRFRTLMDIELKERPVRPKSQQIKTVQLCLMTLRLKQTPNLKMFWNI